MNMTSMSMSCMSSIIDITIASNQLNKFFRKHPNPGFRQRRLLVQGPLTC